MTDLLLDRGDTPTPSRRVVLGAAWVAPVVVAAGAAPAYAASTPASLVFDTLTAYGAAYVGGDPTGVQALVQVRRPWSSTSPDVSGLTVSVLFPATVAAGGPATSVTGTGWTAGPVTGPSGAAGPAGASWTYTFTWNGTLDNAWQSTPQLGFLVPRRAVARTTATVTAYATAPRATAGSRSTDARV